MKSRKLLLSAGVLSTCLTPLSFLTSCGNIGITEVHILESDDIHGEIPGYGDDFYQHQQKSYAGAIRTVQSMQQIVEKYPGSICLAGGDQVSSGAFSTCIKEAQGDTMFKVLQAMDIRYSAVGNHAWDFGKEKLEKYHFDNIARTENTRGNYFVTANVLNRYDGETDLRDKTSWAYKDDDPNYEPDYLLWKEKRVSWADPYKLINMQGNNVALIGLTTVNTLHDSTPEINNYAFASYIPIIHYTKRLMQEEIGQDAFNKIDAFILFTHCSAGQNATTHEVTGEAANLAKNIDTNIDLVLGAHSHVDVAGTVHNDVLNKDIPLAEGRNKMSSFVDVALKFDQSKPAGKRLQSVTPSCVTPHIETSSLEAAAAEIKQIEENPVNNIVAKTVEVYHEQKELTKKELNIDLATSENGCEYWLATPEARGKYYGKNIIEPAGIAACKAEVQGYNMYLDQHPDIGTNKVSCSFISSDSLQGGIPQGQIKKRELYTGLVPYDNNIQYFTLTYRQLEKFVQYLLSGVKTLDGDSLKGSEITTIKFHKDESNPTEDNEIIVDSRSTGDKDKMPWSQTNFHGFTIDVKENTDEPSATNNWSKYSYEADSLRVYNPYNENESIDLPNGGTIAEKTYDAWKGEDYWDQIDETTGHKKLIGFVSSDFNYNQHNHSYLFLKPYAEYNGSLQTSSKAAQPQTISEDIRTLFELFMKYETENDRTIDIGDNLYGQTGELIHIIK